jgi:hypothetical protein
MMNTKRCLLAALAAFVLMHLAGFIGHAVLLTPYYEATKELWRPDDVMQGTMWMLEIYYAAFALLLTYVFVQGRREGGAAEGLRFGVVMGFLTAGLHNLMLYWSMPLSRGYVLGGFAADFLGIVAAGVAISLIYRPAEGAA